MPTGIEITGLALASVSMGGTALSKAVQCGGKGGAQRTYDDVHNQYKQLKDLREDVLVHQYLSEDDKKQIDISIHDISFDLMELHSLLKELKGVAYYQLSKYTVQWFHFNNRVTMALQVIVEVKLEVEARQRSTQGRSKAMVQKDPPIAAAGRGPTCPLAHMHENKPIFVNKDFPSDNSLGQQLAEEIAPCTAAAVRSALKDGMNFGSITKENDTVHTGVGRRSLTETGLGPDLKWHISPKSTTLPPVLVQSGDIELKDLRKDTEID
ncbi:hypothetical protein RHS03_05238, partial [Rhizoctonia solani]